MGAEITITTFGKLRIARDGQPLDGFISSKAALLFVFLALHPGEHPRKKLAAMLWSETHDDQALKNLRTVLSSVRQQVGSAVIVAHETLAVDPSAAVYVDAAVFEAGCQQVFTGAADGDTLRMMQELAGLVQGDFLAGIGVRDAAPLESWISEKQRQLQELHTRLLFEIVETATRATQYDLALAYAWQLVGSEPLWDVAQRQLMRLLAYNNKANEALLHYERFSRLLESELGAQPEAETTALYQQIRGREFMPVNTRATSAQIVLPDMPFVEPVEDIAFAQRMLNTPQCRLLTVFGISGIGKTTLVTQLAFHRQGQYADGTYLIALKETRSARDLPHLIAGALELEINSQSDDAAVEQLVIDRIHNRSMLLVLDNYEQLLPETSFIERILEQTSRVQLILTSQAPLNLFREWLLPLRGLTVPAADDPQPERCEAVRLFELTAQRIDPRFSLAENLAGVTRVCQLVDGLPLAIIIAAGWTQIVTVDRIVQYLEAGQEVSLPLQRSLPGHHQSLDRMLEYTWGTLSSQEQYALTALSVFETGFDLEEAGAICEVDLETLTLLIQRALVQRLQQTYRMHQLVWRYARKKQVRASQQPALAQRYCDYFVSLCERLRADALPLHEHLQVLDVQLTRLWNYEWMPRQFQPYFMLMISRYLLIYWETVQPELLPEVFKLLSAHPPAAPQPALPDSTLLYDLQLARLSLALGYVGQAAHHAEQALTAARNARWDELCLILALVIRLHPLIAPDAATPAANPALLDARRALLQLTAVYTATRHAGALDDLLTHLTRGALLSEDGQPLDHALCMALRGAVAAERGNAAAAEGCFAEALQMLETLTFPVLATAVQHARERVRTSAPVSC